MRPSVAAGKFLRKRTSNNIYATNFEDLSKTVVEIQISNQGSFIAQEIFKLFVSSWNVGGITPPDNSSLENLLDTQNSMADIYVLGFQEIVPLNAGNILGSENSNISTTWNALLKETLNKGMEIEGRLQNTDFGETPRAHPLKMNNSTDSSASDFQCIISKQMGAVSVRFCLSQTSFCFVCSHLASGGKEGDERQRNADAARILSHTIFLTSPFQKLPTKILDHDRVIWLGDLNYRINLPEATTRSLVKNKEWSILLQNDQLKAELAKDHVFEGWHEEEIKFAPTYKYNQNSDDYYGCNTKIKEKKRRSPAWCDRIIWFGKGLKQIQYNRGGMRLSDHRPVQANFTVEVDVLSNKFDDL